jgi:hypothetical protein
VCYGPTGGGSVGVSDSLGQIVFTKLWAGNNLIIVRAKGYKDYLHNIQFREAASDSIDVRLAVVPVEVRELDYNPYR